MRIVAFLLLSTLVMSSCEKPATTISEEEINLFVDNWHKAATNADAAAFFGAMSDESIYIGTDATERWTKQEFEEFAKPYFDRGKAWDFEPRDRLIKYSPDGQTIWFSELLGTWMGVCRSTGIISVENNMPKIVHYQLSVTIPNSRIQDFIDLTLLKEDTLPND